MDFLPCVPTNLIPNVVYQFLKGKPPPPIGKRASKAPYPIRKIEACLLQENTSDEVVVPHQDYLEYFIDKDTEVIGAYRDASDVPQQRNVFRDSAGPGSWLPASILFI